MKTKINKLSAMIRQALFFTGVAGSLFAVGTPVLAAEDQSKVSDLEVIEVTGQKLANARAIAAKQDSASILDAVASDDIGALPDFNIGEAVQRVSGINIINDQAEARFITIRALNPEYNYMTVDGMSMAVPDRNGRRPYMDTLPSSMVSRIEVFKTLTPDMEGTGIGGLVNLVTRSAFDFDDRFFKISGQIGEYENNSGYEGDNKKSGNADFVFADTFGENKDIGLVVTGNYYKRDSYIVKNEFGSNRKWRDANGDSASPYQNGLGDSSGVPERAWLDYHNDRQRHGISVKLDYQPNANSSYWISSFWNTAKDDEARQTDKIGWLNGYEPTINQDGTSTSGHVNARHKIYLGQFDFERSVWASTLGGKHIFDNGGELELNYNNSGSKFRNDEYWFEWQTSSGGNNDKTSDTGFDYSENSDGTYNITLDESANDLSLYQASRTKGLDARGLDEEINEFKVDYSFNADGLDEGWGFKVGAKHRNTDREFFETDEHYKIVDGSSYTLEEAGVSSYGDCFVGGCDSNGNGFVYLDTKGVFSHFAANLSENPDKWSLIQDEKKNIEKNYTLNEGITAAYAMATHTGEYYHLVFGARYEKTSWNGTGFRENSSAGVWEDKKNSGGYSNVLPSVNFTYELMDDVKLRLAYSHALGRVPYNVMAPVGESINDQADNEYGISVSRSNPDLKPRRSRNSDVSLEWYLDNGAGILSAALFHKTLIDEILKDKEDVVIDYQGERVNAIASQYINVDDDINIRGLELNLVKNLTMLPAPFNDLGFSVNATFTETDFAIATEETSAKSVYFNDPNLLKSQADKIINAALFYENDDVNIRLAYNHTGQSLHSVNIKDPWRTLYNEPFAKLDLKASYSFSDNIDFSLTVWNLTDNEKKRAFGRDQELVNTVYHYGRAVFLGFSYKI